MAGVPRARLHALPGPVGLRAGDDPEQRAEGAIDAGGARLDARLAGIVDRDGEAGTVGGGVQRRRGAGVELAPVVGEQQGAQRLADRERACEVLVVEGLAGRGQPALGKPVRQCAGNGERLVAVFQVERIDEVLDQRELVGAGFDITTKIV